MGSGCPCWHLEIVASCKAGTYILLAQSTEEEAERARDMCFGPSGEMSPYKKDPFAKNIKKGTIRGCVVLIRLNI